MRPFSMRRGTATTTAGKPTPDAGGQGIDDCRCQVAAPRLRGLAGQTGLVGGVPAVRQLLRHGVGDALGRAVLPRLAGCVSIVRVAAVRLPVLLGLLSLDLLSKTSWSGLTLGRQHSRDGCSSQCCFSAAIALIGSRLMCLDKHPCRHRDMFHSQA